MKNLVLFITLLCLIQIGKAQVRVEYNSEEPKLKGHIKQIIEYYYINSRKIDSLKNEGKKIENFDEKGNQLDEISYDKLGKLESKTVFDNSKANIVIHSIYDNTGNLIAKTFSKYDNNSNEVESGNYSDETTSSVPDYAKVKFIYKYNERNDRVETDTYLGGNKLSGKEIFIYNHNHQIIEDHLTEYLTNHVSENKSLIQYVSNGSKVISKRFLPNGDLKIEDTSSYSNFDAQGNWLTETNENKVYGIVGGVNIIKSVTKREIIYFK